MKRREASKVIIGGTILASGLGPAFAAAPATLPAGAAAGDVTQDSAVLWTFSTVAGRLAIQYSTQPDFVRGSRGLLLTNTPNQPVKRKITGLQPGTRYYYRVRNAAGDEVTGTFKTPAAVAAGFQGLRFGVSSCGRGELAPFPSLSNAASRGLDFYVEHGDNIYADYPSPAVPVEQATTLEEFRAKYREVYFERFGVGYYQALRTSTAIFAINDDHELTNDFAGGASPASDPRFSGQPGTFINETPFYANAFQAFQEYNPVTEEFYGATGDPRTAGKRKIYRYRTFGKDAALIVTDARTFRDQPLPTVANPTDPIQVASFLIGAFNPQRTMLGAVQLADLKADLLNAQQAGITWKFVFVGQAVFNLGVVGGEDRFEGYAAERSNLMAFLNANNIKNVVFVAGDLHGMLVSNITFQAVPFGPQIDTGAFGLTTGCVAFDAPIGPTLITIAAALGLITPEQLAFYNTLPQPGKDAFVQNLINTSLAALQQNYRPIGLGAPLNATLNSGSYSVAHTYQWTEFEVNAQTQALTVTTYGVSPYTQVQLEANPGEVVNRVPTVLSQFTVQAQ